jgi:hypothetical protein
MTAETGDQGVRWIDAHLHLLDRQVLDAHGVPIAVVDDLELSSVPVGLEIPVDTPPPVITALLSGPVLGTRIFGGRPPRSRMHRTPWEAVVDVGVVIKLAIGGATTDLTWTERWVRDRIIARIPGGRHNAGGGPSGGASGKQSERSESTEQGQS